MVKVSLNIDITVSAKLSPKCKQQAQQKPNYQALFPIYQMLKLNGQSLVRTSKPCPSISVTVSAANILG